LMIVAVVVVAEPCGEGGVCVDSCDKATQVQVDDPSCTKQCCLTKNADWCSAMIKKEGVVAQDTPVVGMCRTPACLDDEEALAVEVTPISCKSCCISKKFMELAKSEKYQAALTEALKKPTFFFESAAKASLKRSTPTLPLRKRAQQGSLKPTTTSFLQQAQAQLSKATCLKRGELTPVPKHKPDSCTHAGTINAVANTPEQGCCTKVVDVEDNAATSADCGTFQNANVLGGLQGDGPCCKSNCVEMGGKEVDGVCHHICESGNTPQVSCMGWFCVDLPRDCRNLWISVTVVVGPIAVSIISAVIAAGSVGGVFTAAASSLSSLFNAQGFSVIGGVITALFKVLVPNTCANPNPALIPWRQ